MAVYESVLVEIVSTNFAQTTAVGYSGGEKTGVFAPFGKLALHADVPRGSRASISRPLIFGT